MFRIISAQFRESIIIVSCFDDMSLPSWMAGMRLSACQLHDIGQAEEESEPLPPAQILHQCLQLHGRLEAAFIWASFAFS